MRPLSMKAANVLTKTAEDILVTEMNYDVDNNAIFNKLMRIYFN